MATTPRLATALEEQGLGYVLAVAYTHRVPTAGGPIHADHLVRGLPTRARQILSAGAGSKGPRLYSWAVVPIPAEQPGQRKMMVRRNDNTGELAYYRCYTPPRCRCVNWSAWPGNVGGSRSPFKPRKAKQDWTNTKFAGGAPGTGGPPWPRSPWPSFSVTAAAEKEDTPAPEGLIPITLNELRRLFDTLVIGATATPEHVLNCSFWRRKHQAAAHQCHYRRSSQHPEPDLLL